MMSCALLDNKRAIRHVTVNYTDTESGEFTVGEGDVTAIEVVIVHGEMAGVPWFSITREDKLDTMVNARFVSCVVYEEE